eukprot:5577026-Pyramimonas_sp.AAC.1
MIWCTQAIEVPVARTHSGGCTPRPPLRLPCCPKLLPGSDYYPGGIKKGHLTCRVDARPAGKSAEVAERGQAGEARVERAGAATREERP